MKPVLFSAIDDDEPKSSPRKTSTPAPVWTSRLGLDAVDPEHPYRAVAASATALVVDLPGAESAIAGADLADLGFRPVPLYNAVASPAAVIDVQPIVDALVVGAERVARARIDGAPAFLLHSDRLGEGRPLHPGKLDNRSVCRAADFPSADTLTRAGIERVVVVCERLASDLEEVLLVWQQEGIALQWKSPDDDDAPVPLVLARRWWGRRLFDMARRSALRRREDGSYGALIEPSSGNG